MYSLLASLLLLVACPALGSSMLVAPPDAWDRASLFQEPDAPQCRARWSAGHGAYQGYLQGDGVIFPFSWPPGASEIHPWRVTDVHGWVRREPVQAEVVTAISTPQGREWVPMAMPAIISAGDPIALRFVVPEDSVFL